MTLSNSLLYVPFISRPLHPKTPFSLFCSSNVSRSLRISFLLLLILNCHLPSQFFFFFFAYHFLSTSPLPGRLSHVFVCFNSSAHSVSASSPFFPFFRPLIHNLCLDRKQRDGASVLMNNNRNWERHTERESESGILRQPSFANCLSGWHLVSRSICQTVSDCVFLSVSTLSPWTKISTHHAVRLNQVWLTTAILRPQCHPEVCLNNRALRSVVFVCLLFPTPGSILALTHLECLHHLALWETEKRWSKGGRGTNGSVRKDWGRSRKSDGKRKSWEQTEMRIMWRREGKGDEGDGGGNGEPGDQCVKVGGPTLKKKAGRCSWR